MKFLGGMSALLLCCGLFALTVSLGRSTGALIASALMWGIAFAASLYLLPRVASSDAAPSFRIHLMMLSGFFCGLCVIYALFGSNR